LLTFSKPSTVGFEALDQCVALAETCFELNACGFRGGKPAFEGSLRQGGIECLRALLALCG
jgi:hypothetical protein